MTELYNDISRSSFISIISDVSTDNSSIEQEILFVRYVINGEINDKYVATQPVDIPDSSSIYSALKQHLNA